MFINLDTTEKDPGVTFNNNFYFDLHIEQMVNKASKLKGLIKKDFHIYV